MRNLISYGIALAIIVVIGLWMATGTIIQGGQGEGSGDTPVFEALGVDEDSPLRGLAEEFGLAPGPGEPEGEIEIAQADVTQDLRSVRIRSFAAELLPIEVSLRGQTEASASIAVRAETSGVLQTRHVDKGDTVAPGDRLCSLDAGTRQARVAQAEAALAQAQQDFESNRSLREKGIAPANSGRALESALAAAQAGVDEARAELDRTEVHAEVGGVVQNPIAEPGDMLSAGAVCVTLVQLDPMLFVGSVPEARIALARTGLSASIETVGGDSVDGEVTFISSVADAATRSFPVEIEFANPGGTIRDGLTASAKVVLGATRAHLIPQSVLTLDDEGTLGVRAVEGGIVAFHPVTIVTDSRDGVWVTGLPSSVDVITLGQEYVKAGQAVDAGTVDGVAEETRS